MFLLISGAAASGKTTVAKHVSSRLEGVIVGNGPSEHAYSRWTNWQQTDERWKVNIIGMVQNPVFAPLQLNE